MRIFVLLFLLSITAVGAADSVQVVEKKVRGYVFPQIISVHQKALRSFYQTQKIETVENFGGRGFIESGDFKISIPWNSDFIKKEDRPIAEGVVRKALGEDGIEAVVSFGDTHILVVTTLTNMNGFLTGIVLGQMKELGHDLNKYLNVFAAAYSILLEDFKAHKLKGGDIPDKKSWYGVAFESGYREEMDLFVVVMMKEKFGPFKKAFGLSDKKGLELLSKSLESYIMKPVSIEYDAKGNVVTAFKASEIVK